MESVKIAFDTEIQPGDTVAWFSRGRQWAKGKVERIRQDRFIGYKYDYVLKTSVPEARTKTTVTVRKDHGIAGYYNSPTTFSNLNNLLKVDASGGIVAKV